MSELTEDDAILVLRHGKGSFRNEIINRALETAKEKYGAYETLKEADTDNDHPFSLHSINTAAYEGNLIDLFGEDGDYYIYDDANTDPPVDDARFRDFEHNFQRKDLVPVVEMEPEEDEEVYYFADGYVYLITIEIVYQLQEAVNESSFSPRNFVAFALDKRNEEKEIAEMMDISVGNVRGKKYEARQTLRQAKQTSELGESTGYDPHMTD